MNASTESELRLKSKELGNAIDRLTLENDEPRAWVCALVEARSFVSSHRRQHWSTRLDECLAALMPGNRGWRTAEVLAFTLGGGWAEKYELAYARALQRERGLIGAEPRRSVGVTDHEQGNGRNMITLRLEAMRDNLEKMPKRCEVTAYALARLWGCVESTANSHLNALEADGLVKRRYVQKGSARRVLWTRVQ